MGIGASAGGLEALEKFLTEVEPNSGAAYVVVTHQAPGRTTLLPELLAKHSKLPVKVAADGMSVVPDEVYVSPPGCCIEIQGKTLKAIPLDSSDRRLPVDHFFRSLARDDGESAIGVVLSGNGTDGTLGITEIKGSSGMVMAQAPDTARYTGMPQSAIATELVDYVLPPEKMPGQLRQYIAGRYRTRAPDREEPDDGVAALQRILSVLRVRTGNDFSGYKKSTVERRVARRMTVHGIASSKEYAKFLEKTPSELDALFKELLISVTSFFRDPEAFQSLERELGRIVAARADDTPLRIWVSGCSTGEEAYSIAILVKEIQRGMGKNLRAQIFATDLDLGAVEVARSGRYPEGIAADVSKERLERYFTREDSGYRVNKEIRELLIFASQNIIKDPPFTKLDLLCCRNLLIYLEPELQKRVLSLFSYALRPAGLLFLGTSESVAGFDNRFTSADKKWKIFQRRPKASRPSTDFPAELASSPVGHRTSAARPPQPPATPGIGHLAERVLLDAFVPPSVIVSERGDLLFVHGRTGPFLEPAPGEPMNNVFNMAREGLKLELPTILQQAATSDAPIVRRGLQVKTNGGFTAVRLHARKLAQPEAMRGVFIVTFELEPEREEPPEGKGGKNHRVHLRRIKALEDELKRTKENLQGTIEELETSNEELKSTNEELQSTNEELQSANEELETSREEMQSLNEELQTVNAEFEERNRALSQANDDMQNLLNSTEIATIFLDDKLAIKRFTTQAKKVFSLIDTDVGRPISDLAANLRYDVLVEDAREVLRSLVIREREIQTKEGAWRLMRVMPYRTHDNVIDGLVITFVDIDRVKRAEQDSQIARAFAESIVESVRDALLVIDPALRVLSANRAFYDLFHTTPKLVVGEPIEHLGDGQWDKPELVEALQKVVASREGHPEVSFEMEFPGIGRKVVFISGRQTDGNAIAPTPILLSVVDETRARPPVMSHA